jgi:hypothetical protein
LGGLSTQSSTIEPDQIPKEISDQANATGLGKIGLGYEPGRLVDPEVGIKADQIMGPGQKMWQDGVRQKPG